MGASHAMKLGVILRARCPECGKGKITRGIFSLNQICPECSYDFHPEPGFYLGAMAVSFLLTAMLTIPPMAMLKIMGAEMAVLIVFPFVEFAFIGTFLLFYSRVLWLHVAHRMSRRLDG